MLQATKNRHGDLPPLKETILQNQVKASSLAKKKKLLKRIPTKREIQKGLPIKEHPKADFSKISLQEVRGNLPLGKIHPIGRRKKLLGIPQIVLKKRIAEEEKSLEANSTSPVLVQPEVKNPDSRKGSIRNLPLFLRIEEVEKIFRRIKLHLLQEKSASTKEEVRIKSPFTGLSLSHSIQKHQPRKEDLGRTEASLSN